ncbi:MAG TPA: sodium-dependent transporter [Nitrospiria bacterium]|jgi:NSS family neurotransmitter:Na+ symporter
MGEKSPVKREIWGSQAGFILAAVGSAVGLGNIWRFSYLAYDNGGGAFLVPYFLALFLAGIPLLILEFGIGHERNGSAPLAFARISRKWEWLGWWAVVFVMFGIVLYYAVIISWCLNYLVLSFSLAWGDDPNAFFFDEFLKKSEGPFQVGNIQIPILVGLAIVWFFNWAIIYRGIRQGIELANKIFMPLLFLLTAVLVIWSLTLEGAGTGLRAYLMPEFKALLEPKVWIDAFSQVFFSLSLGFGIMITYASYLPRRADITRSAVITALLDSGFAVFAGLAVFSLLGYMAGQTQSSIEEVVTASIGLAFVAYPKAISLLPGGAVFGVLFFASLVVAGLSSSISIIEAFTSAVMDKFSFNRKRVVTTVCIVGFLGGLIFTSQGGLFWLDIVDHYITHFGLVVVGLLEAFLVGWLFQIETLRKHINAVSKINLGPWWNILIKMVVPIVLVIILGGDLVSELSKPYEGYSWKALILIGLFWLAITFLVALVFTWMPWKKQPRQMGK